MIIYSIKMGEKPSCCRRKQPNIINTFVRFTNTSTLTKTQYCINMNLVQVWSWVCLNFFEKESICKLFGNAFMQFRALNRVGDTFQVMIGGKLEKSHITNTANLLLSYTLSTAINNQHKSMFDCMPSISPCDF